MERRSNVARLEGTELAVWFGRKLTSGPFRPAMEDFWLNRSRHGRIVFLLEDVEWSSLPELVELSLIAHSLNAAGAKVAVAYPSCAIDKSRNQDEAASERRARVCSFLERMRFGVWLEKHGIRVDGRDQGFPRYGEREDAVETCVIPITEFDFRDACVERCSQARAEVEVREILAQFRCLDPIDSRALEDVLAWELSENAYLWSRVDAYLDREALTQAGIAAECIESIGSLIGRTFACRGDLEAALPKGLDPLVIPRIVQSAVKTKDVAAVIAARIVKRNMPGVGELTSTDAPYFNSIHGGAYLELVVADNGGGLTETLGPSFDRDLQEKQSQLRPHYNRWLGTGKPGRDAAIARYAFEQWSTSRPVSRLLHPDSPRGLWWVYDITRYYHGYLGLRSGCAQVGLDLRAHGYTEGAVLSGAREFAGTLIQVVLPRLRMDELRSQTTRPPGPPRTSSDAMLIRLADCSHLQAVVQRVENAAAGARDTTLVLDCATCSLEPETALHLLLVLSRLQNPADNVLVVMANVPTGHESIVGAMREFTGFDQRERLVPVLFTSGRCDLAGPGADRYRSEIREVMTGGRLPVPASPDPGGAGLEPGPAEVERFFLRNSHLFHLTTHYNVGVLSASVHESFSGGRYGWLSWR